MKNKIQDKIEVIEEYLEKLYLMMPQTLEEYKNDYKTKFACERCFEIIINASVDLTFLVIKEKNLKIPEDDETSFSILSQSKIIPENLSSKLREAKGMRNIIAHDYGEIDDSIVFNSVREEFEEDINRFLKLIRISLNIDK